MMKFAVNNPVRRRTSGARRNRTKSEKKVGQPRRASTGRDCEWGVTTRQPPESLPSAMMKARPLRQYGSSCTAVAGL